MPDRFHTALDWEDVRVFVALARRGSLSAAARALGVNHATVARRIAALEASLGRPLFERRPTGYVLTPAGQAALDSAAAMEEAAAALVRAEDAEGPAGTVRLTATRSIGEGFLIHRLGELLRRHPGLDIELIPAIRTMSLARGEADLALRFGRPADGELTGRRVATVGFGFYAGEDWRRRLAEGEAPRFIGFDEASAQVPEAVWLARQFPAARLCLRTDSHVSQAAAVAAGCGIALLPHFLAATDPRLMPVTGMPAPPARELWLLSRRAVAPVPRLRVVADFLVELFRSERARFAGPAPH